MTLETATKIAKTRIWSGFELKQLITAALRDLPGRARSVTLPTMPARDVLDNILLSMDSEATYFPRASVLSELVVGAILREAGDHLGVLIPGSQNV